MIKNADIYIEPPKPLGEGVEFFKQPSEPNAVSCNAHIHNSIELLYVKRGSYQVLLDNCEYEIFEGDLILFCSNSIHHVIAKDMAQNEYYVIKVPPALFLEFSGREMGLEYVMRFALNREGEKNIWRHTELEERGAADVLSRLVEEYERNDYASDIGIKLRIMELMLWILRDSMHTSNVPAGKTAELIYGVMTYVRKNYAEDIDERELARSIGMSYSYFARSFNKIAGMPFRKYLNVTRIHRAEQILCTSNDSITEIAAKCGYNSTSYFISVYKNVTGKTPSRVRRVYV